jgi:hypothetical protein
MDASSDGANGSDAASSNAGFTYVKASNTGNADLFGHAVALSSDGNTLVVGAVGEASSGVESDDSLPVAGAVYVYVRSGGTWAEQAYLKAPHPHQNDRFGISLAISGDGNRLLIGANGDASCSTGVDSDDTPGTCAGSGAAYIFERAGATWSFAHYLKPSNTTITSTFPRAFGFELAISSDGSTVAVGGTGDASDTTGIDGDQTSITAQLSGAVYVFSGPSGTWLQEAYIKASNAEQNDGFGRSVALSQTGDTMVVGAPGESGGSSGVNGAQSDNSKFSAGAVYVFERSTVWEQTAYVKASNSDMSDQFGVSVAMADSGMMFAVGAVYEASSTTGVGGDQSDNSLSRAGAVYVFAKTTGWAQSGYLKGPHSAANDSLGWTVAMSGDGLFVAGGAYGESGIGTGVTTYQPPPTNFGSGAVYTFHLSGPAWEPVDYIKASNANQNDEFGISVAMSAHGNVIVVGAEAEQSRALGINGDQSDNSLEQSGAAYIIE